MLGQFKGAPHALTGRGAFPCEVLTLTPPSCSTSKRGEARRPSRDDRRVKLKIETFVVRGPVPFPLEMLCRDACWPASAADALLIEYSLTGRQTDAYELALQTQRPGAPDRASWKIAGWEVVT